MAKEETGEAGKTETTEKTDAERIAGLEKALVDQNASTVRVSEANVTLKAQLAESQAKTEKLETGSKEIPEQLSDLQAKLEVQAVELARSKAQAKHGLPEEVVAGLQGTPAQVEASAAAIAKALGTKPKAGEGKGEEGKELSEEEKAAEAAKVAAAAKKDDKLPDYSGTSTNNIDKLRQDVYDSMEAEAAKGG